MTEELIDSDEDSWRKDTQLMSSLGRGVYREICGWLNIHPIYGGVFTGSRDELARAGRCTADELAVCLRELSRKPAVANVSECNGIVTLVCRRLKRQANQRNNNRFRVQRHRCNGHVTPAVTRPVTPSGSFEDPFENGTSKLKDLKDSKLTSKLSEERGSGGKPEPSTRCWTPFRQSTRRELEIWQLCMETLGDQWPNDSTCWGNRIYGSDRVQADADKVERVMNAVLEADKNGEIKTTRAQTAQHFWNTFQSYVRERKDGAYPPAT